MHFKTLFISLAVLVLYTAAHSVILSAQGDGGKPSTGKGSGPIGAALGVDPSTPRNGAAADPYWRDTTLFYQRSLRLWRGCGQTTQSGVLDVNTQTTKLVKQGQIAQVSAGGFLYMVLHQINGHGNGPYECAIDTTGAGASYPTSLTVTRQVPGNSPIVNAVSLMQFPLQLAMPAGLKCTGSYSGMNNICMIRCQNSDVNNPYGACIPVQVV